MKSFPRNLIMRLGAFIGVMAFCYGLVVIGAWRMSVVAPTLSVSLPSFDVAIKASPVTAHLHATKTAPCPTSSARLNQADTCKTEKHMCGRHDGDSCGAASLYCGCHAHDDKHPGTATSGAPDSLPATVVISYANHDRLPVLDDPASREFLITFKRERPPSFLPV